MQKLSDHEILTDLFFTQSSLAQSYSSAALQSPHTALRNEMLSLMNEEHRLHANVLSELEKRGCHTAPAAAPEQISQMKEKFKKTI